MGFDRQVIDIIVVRACQAAASNALPASAAVFVGEIKFTGTVLVGATGTATALLGRGSPFGIR